MQSKSIIGSVRLPITENQILKGRVKARIKELEVRVILATSIMPVIPTATSLALPMAQHAHKDPCTAVQADAQKPEDSFRALFQAG